MKIIKYIVALTIFVLISIVVAFLALYYRLPKLREIQCVELASANKIGSDHPYFSQGILLGIGTLFFIIVTTFEECWKGKKAKWHQFLRNQAFVLIGFCFTIGALMIIISSPKLSPSFVDACKPDPPVSALCGNTTKEFTRVNVTCTAHPTRWIPALSQGYPHMIALQTYLMFTLIGWTICAKSSDGIASFFIGFVTMGLLFGIGAAAVSNNEVGSHATSMEFLAGVLGSGVYWALVWSFWAILKQDDPELARHFDDPSPQLPHHFDDPSPHLPNPGILQPGQSAQINPAQDASPPPSYDSLFNL